MPVLFDTTILLPLLNPEVPAPPDPKTGLPISHLQQRIQALIKQLEREKTTIVIPTPVLAEVLVRAEKAAEQYYEIINESAYFRIVSFDQRAALEVAAMAREAREAGDKREGSDETWAKIKFDRQIVAIAKIARVSKIYSDDKHVSVLATRLGIEVASLAELALPPEERQPQLPLETVENPALGAPANDVSAAPPGGPGIEPASPPLPTSPSAAGTAGAAILPEV
jgi:predicted nucleic acid-binding protein